MNLETTNQPQQSDLRRETFFSLTANLSLQWLMATGCVLCLWRKTERWQKSSSLLSQRFRARQSPRLHVVWHVICLLEANPAA